MERTFEQSLATISSEAIRLQGQVNRLIAAMETIPEGHMNPREFKVLEHLTKAEAALSGAINDCQGGL